MKRFAVFLTLVLSTVAAQMFCLAASGQTYPTKPIRLIVPFAAGGDIDSIARVLAEHLQSTWGQPALVESRPGAAGTIGSDFVAKSAPDGYTLLMCSAGPITISPSLYSTLPYTVERDFEPVVLIGGAPLVLLVNDTVPAATFAEFLTLAKSKPGMLTVASSGVGSMAHLTAMAFGSETGVKLTHVPYKGSAPAVQDLLGGHVNLSFNPMPSALAALASGKVRALAITSEKRSPILPDVPTLNELGVNGFDAVSWYGICAPSGIPQAVVRQLHSEINRATSLAAIQERIRLLGTDTRNATIEEFRALLQKDANRWSRVIRDNDIRAN